jgi:thiosulfate dehydrogenase [quinone] large subunit
LSPSESLTARQQFVLVLFRFAVGWHLFYQGMGKLQAARWSALGYLKGATGPLDGFFHWMAADSRLVQLADRATVWGLMAVGMLVMIGLMTRIAAVAGMLLLLLFYLAQPPLPDHGFIQPTIDGYEMYVNKVLLEVLALAIVGLVFDTGRISGLDLLVRSGRQDAASKAVAPSTP